MYSPTQVECGPKDHVYVVDGARLLVFDNFGNFLRTIADWLLHLDKHLTELVDWAGPWSYAVLFLIVFCETGLVVTPFLPGDSLLFAIGALASIEGSPISMPVIAALLIVAAISGDAVNYAIGRASGRGVFAAGDGTGM